MCNVAIPPRSGMVLGLSTLAFITLKLEQLLAGDSSETDEEKNRAILKERKVEVARWLETSVSFVRDSNSGIITTHALEESIDKPFCKIHSRPKYGVDIGDRHPNNVFQQSQPTSSNCSKYCKM